MSAKIHYGPKILTERPLRDFEVQGLPDNVVSMRIRYRPDSFATAYVRTTSGVSSHVILVEESGYHLGFKLAENQTINMGGSRA